jgi:hypothetical protein
MNERTNVETLVDQLRACTTAAHAREDGTIEAWFTFTRRDAKDYQLGWVIDPDRRRVRKLLDYDGWVRCDMTPAAILAAVERKEKRDSRRCFPGFPEYWCMGVQR